MEDFFTEQQGQTMAANHNNNSQVQRQDDDEFQFGNNANNQDFYNQVNEYQTADNGDPFAVDQNLKRMREEEDRINELLRNKANQEYDEKEKRRQRGRKDLEEFMASKEEQKADRRQQNLKKEQTQKQNIRSLNQTAGWKKVVANVPLKQGEHPGSKDVNRMREALLHKREDMQAQLK